MSTVASGSDEPKGPRPASVVPTPKMRRGLKTYFSEVAREMRKVSWPSRHETNRLFGVVMAVTIMLVTGLSVLGYLFDVVIQFVTKGTF